MTGADSGSFGNARKNNSRFQGGGGGERHFISEGEILLVDRVKGD